VLGFAPRLPGEHFRCFFTAAEGWGTLAQTRTGRSQSNQVWLRFGELRLRELRFELGEGMQECAARLVRGAREVACKVVRDGRRVTLQLSEPLVLAAGETLHAAFDA
jgi:hypothetical protein